MSGPHGPEVGAELGELYKKGVGMKDTIADPIKQAGSKISEELCMVEMWRSHDFGTGSYGPSGISDAQLALAGVVRALGDQLIDVGDGIVATARDMAKVDAATEAAFKKEGGKLE